MPAGKCAKCGRNASPKWWKCCPKHTPLEDESAVVCEECMRDLHPPEGSEEDDKPLSQKVFPLMWGYMHDKVVGRIQVVDDEVRAFLLDGQPLLLAAELVINDEDTKLVGLSVMPFAAEEAEAKRQERLGHIRTALLKYHHIEDSGTNLPPHSEQCQWVHFRDPARCTCGAGEVIDNWRPDGS